MFWADTVGPKHIYASLKKWEEVYGGFYKPSRYLEERATRGVPLVTILYFSSLCVLNFNVEYYFCVGNISQILL